MKRFTLHPSRIHFFSSAILHSAVFVLVFLAALPLWLKLIALAFCLLSVVVAERARTRTLRYQTLLFDGDNFILVDKVGREELIALREGLWSTPWLLALPFCLQDLSRKKGVLVLFRDSLEADDWRQLRVILRTRIQVVDEFD